MNCAICLPVINCEEYLINVFNNLLKIKILFNKTAIIFGYDKSNDKSLSLLQEFKKNNLDIDIDILVNENKRSKYRTHNLEYIRNLMFGLVLEKYNNYDYYITIDSDNVCSNPINLDILEKHINNYEKWDIITFNKDDYYDIWALQYDIYIHHCRCFGYNSWPVIDFIKSDITTKLNNLKENEYFPVYSAFNGFGVYKLKYLKNAKYDGKKQYYFPSEKVEYMINYLNKNIKNKKKEIKITDNKENCEHIGFHMSVIAENKNIRIMITKDILF